MNAQLLFGILDRARTDTYNISIYLSGGGAKRSWVGRPVEVVGCDEVAGIFVRLQLGTLAGSVHQDYEPIDIWLAPEYVAAVELSPHPDRALPVEVM